MTALVSVVGIIRNIRSRVLFSQFVGRCIRRAHENDNITAQVISHVTCTQDSNIDELSYIDPPDEDGMELESVEFPESHNMVYLSI
jgi:hypothetical protein